jgi:hypothetical protein
MGAGTSAACNSGSEVGAVSATGGAAFAVGSGIEKLKSDSEVETVSAGSVEGGIAAATPGNVATAPDQPAGG